jgi:hypothetical protein
VLIHIETRICTHDREAHAAAVAIAVDMGVIDFIEHSSPEAVAKRGLMLTLLDAPGSVQEPSETDAEVPSVKESRSAAPSGTPVVSSHVGYSSSIASRQAVSIYLPISISL